MTCTKQHSALAQFVCAFKALRCRETCSQVCSFWGFLVFVHAVTLCHFAVLLSRRLVRLLHGLAQIKCQVCVATVSAVDFVDDEKGLQ